MANGNRDWEFNLHEESLVHGEILFLKRQQWSVTNYALLLYGGLIGLTQLSGCPVVVPLCILRWAVTPGVVVVSSWFLWDLSDALRTQQDRADSARKLLNKERWAGPRSPDSKNGEKRGEHPGVLLFLSAALLVGGWIACAVLGADECPALIVVTLTYALGYGVHRVGRLLRKKQG